MIPDTLPNHVQEYLKKNQQKNSWKKPQNIPKKPQKQKARMSIECHHKFSCFYKTNLKTPYCFVLSYYFFGKITDRLKIYLQHSMQDTKCINYFIIIKITIAFPSLHIFL